MVYDYYTKNKKFIKAYKNFRAHGHDDPDTLLTLNNKSLTGISAFKYNLGITQQGMVISEMLSNPWYVIREVVRQEVGSTKRFLNLSDGELLALDNFYRGGRTFVSAPKMTGNTTILALAVLSTLPKVVIYSNPTIEQTYAKEIRSTMNKIVKILPNYIQRFYRKNFPTFIPLNEVHTDKGMPLSVKGFDNKDVIMIHDNYEFDKSFDAVDMERLNKDRTSHVSPIRHILASSVNPDLSRKNSNYINALDKCRYDNISQPIRVKGMAGMGLFDLLVTIGIEDNPRFKSDRAKLKYYKKIILNVSGQGFAASLQTR